MSEPLLIDVQQRAPEFSHNHRHLYTMTAQLLLINHQQRATESSSSFGSGVHFSTSIQPIPFPFLTPQLDS